MNILAMVAFMIAAVSAQQGQAVRLALPDEPGMESAEIRWQGRTLPYTRSGEEWITVLGVDLDMKAGNYPGEIRVKKDGKVRREAITITVRAVKFPVERLTVPEQFVQLSPENTERALREQKEIEEIHKTLTGLPLWEEPFVAPIPGGTGSNFGKRRVFNGESRNPHGGADLRATTGTPILATNKGRVVLAKDLFFTGNTVIVDHGLGIYTLYAHLSEINVEKDATVERGQVVGLAGATGRVTGPHLHWGARVQNSRVDPFSLVSLGK
jgi:murein DD-endopeptidase MepM/ murein hydrolase activator NlpD